nr:unnamed protein product [Callosobruchus chinensis]
MTRNAKNMKTSATLTPNFIKNETSDGQTDIQTDGIESVLLYVAEAWTLKAAAINRIEAFEMWTLRRMLKISWTEHVRNDDVLRMARLEDRELFEHIKKRKISYLRHIILGEPYEFQRLILQGKIEGGKRGIGRKKLSWLRNIRQWT